VGLQLLNKLPRRGLVSSSPGGQQALLVQQQRVLYKQGHDVVSAAC
jgi:hypothetical protein